MQGDSEAENDTPKAQPSEPVEEHEELEILITLAVAQVDEQLDQENKTGDLQSFMHDTGMHPQNPDTSTTVVHLPERGEDRILTAVYNPQTGETVLHDTSIPHVGPDLTAPSTRPQEVPFLKAGRHGRGGDVENDPDRETGRGHDINPTVQREFSRYHRIRDQLLRTYPRYPQVRDGGTVPLNVKQLWEENERWYINFKKTYKGYFVAHLWPCGCEVPRDGDESEED
jgi:hypothetical protein